MFCSKCGEKVDGKFCSKCGTPVGNNNNTTSNVTTTPKKKSHVGLILGIIFGVLFLLIVIIVIVALLFVRSSKNVEPIDNTKHLVCTSSEGKITLNYNDDEIIDYTADKITYNQESQQKLFEKYGAESYMEQFNTWFEKNTSGTCVIKDSTGKVIKSYNTNKSNSNSKSSNTKVKVVGEDNYGYIEVPANWNNFQDVDGGHSIQFSYGQTYIATLDYVENSVTTAKYVADKFYDKMLEDESVTDVKKATTTVGKEKYTAYEISMYYPDDNIYLYTYWFDTKEDNYIHYIALEGPSSVKDYLTIVDTFSLTK